MILWILVMHFKHVVSVICACVQLYIFTSQVPYVFSPDAQSQSLLKDTDPMNTVAGPAP